MIPATLIDALPERLWWTGNDYLVFGRSLHLCVGPGGNRTVELDGSEVGRGTRLISDFAHPPNERTVDRMSEVDLGWAAVVAGAVLVVAVAALRRRP